MKNLRKWLVSSGLLMLLITMSGCVKTDKAGNPTGEGIIYNFLVKPMSQLLTYLADNLGLGFGLAIIVLTLVVRLIILPLGLSQMKKSTIQQEKIAALKPHMDVINAKMKNTQSQEELVAAQQELQKLYKENDISIVGGIGCLPLLIQMPIFTALFFAAKVTPGISESVFLGINLGKPSLLLVAIAGISYFVQSFVTMIGMDEAQKKQMRMMSYISPLMIIFISFSSPAGVTLYWAIGGIFSCIQSAISTLYQKPKIKRELEAYFEKNPIKVSTTGQLKDVTPSPKKKEPAKKATVTNKNGRNAGKQQRKK
ncbi:OxaA precursor [Vagococcus penaei]|uniref:Membrane protein insertase YidC n=1 Tax=Vagococcus penaei TaxID=633807 RepID=A0A1Q2D8M1_9ENTE|nr:membrane protein insertase YidC [Vagococcus penaei]AQP54726.1 OxaA precursor [Vagococcus penaei]RSU05382.1 OxaA precursor [Vagococcus penaei]